MKQIKALDIKRRKGKKKVTMLTCYDYSFAQILDKSDIDMLLVGDSLANVVLGMKETRKVSTTEMINHTKAVASGAKRALVVADMPAASYQRNPAKAVYYAKKFIAAGAGAVKVEWFKSAVSVIKRLRKANIPVMGHIGLTPQTAHLLGGFKVQGKDRAAALNLIAQAKQLEKLGCFSVVLECIPSQVSKMITKAVKMPTIGIGAGKYCDGQVLVLYDLLGFYQRMRPKFVKVYKDLSKDINKAVLNFTSDVKKGKFPTEKESFSINKDELKNLSKR
jgi:3-methyl-2-oxobutanoate hydroxymethyltransferase